MAGRFLNDWHAARNVGLLYGILEDNLQEHADGFVAMVNDIMGFSSRDYPHKYSDLVFNIKNSCSNGTKDGVDIIAVRKVKKLMQEYLYLTGGVKLKNLYIEVANLCKVLPVKVKVTSRYVLLSGVNSKPGEYLYVKRINEFL